MARFRQDLKQFLGSIGLLPAAQFARATVHNAANQTSSVFRSSTRGIQSSLGATSSAAQYAWEQWRYKSAANGLPIPPRRLNYLVTGITKVSKYVEVGKRAFQTIVQCMERNGVNWKEFDAVLDFGCGSGRVIRYWKGYDIRAFGSDYNPELIQWCQKKLKFAQFDVNQLDPPLPYKDQTFNLVYALSVFTHLDEPRQHTWIAELLRVIRPGGYLLMTTHGDCDYYHQHLTAEELAKFRAGQLVVKNQNHVGENCCNAYHPIGYVKDVLATHFEVLDFKHQGALGNLYQDLYLLRKPAVGTDRRTVAA